MSRRSEDLSATDRAVDVTDRRDANVADRHVSDRHQVDTRDTVRRDTEHASAPRPSAPAAPAPVEGNGTAIAAFVLGLLAVTYSIMVAAAPAGLLFGLIALVMGAKGMGNANRLDGLHKGLAITGLVTGLLALLLAAAVAFGGFQLFQELQNNPQIQQQIQDAAENVQS